MQANAPLPLSLPPVPLPSRLHPTRNFILWGEGDVHVWGICGRPHLFRYSLHRYACNRSTYPHLPPCPVEGGLKCTYPQGITLLPVSAPVISSLPQSSECFPAPVIILLPSPTLPHFLHFVPGGREF